MKKMLTFMLTVVMVMGLLGVAIAYDEEITFQDMPWYESKTKTDIENSSKNADIEQTKKAWVREIDKKGAISAEEFDAGDKEIFGFAKNVKIGTIAGYNDVYANMNYLIDGDEWKLYKVELFMGDVKNYEEAYADLKRKLESLYGEASIYTSGVEYSYWIGANDTAIILVKPSEVYAFTLTYEKMDVKDYIQQAIEDYVAPVTPSNNVPDTTDGL